MQVHGTVIHIDQLYAGKRGVSILRTIARIALAVVLAPVALFAWLLFGMLSRNNRGRPTFVSAVAVRVAGFWAGRKIVDNTVAVRDVRVRDGAGRQWLVRICGHLKSGNVIVGDVVTMDGVDRNGTLWFRKGTNHTIRCRLIGS